MAKISVILLVAVVVVLLLVACTNEEIQYYWATWDPITSPLTEPTPTPVPLPADYKIPVLTCNWLGECELK